MKANPCFSSNSWEIALLGLTGITGQKSVPQPVWPTLAALSCSPGTQGNPCVVNLYTINIFLPRAAAESREDQRPLLFSFQCIAID